MESKKKRKKKQQTQQIKSRVVDTENKQVVSRREWSGERNEIGDED